MQTYKRCYSSKQRIKNNFEKNKSTDSNEMPQVLEIEIEEEKSIK